MNRVLYFSGTDVTAFHWQGQKFIGKFTFTENDQGYKDFSRYLEAVGVNSIRILVDVIEEDFVKEKIPHLGKKDQAAIAERYINRHYRNSQDYYTFKIVGRENIGRKDDIVLYSVITKPDIFSKWFKLIESKKIAVAGIWSLPLISEAIYKKISKQNGNILLVSQQVPGHLRQSFYRNNKFEISRSAVINLEDMPLGQYIAEEVEQTSRFLANQRYIGFDEVIHIHVICSEDDQESIRKICEDTPLKIFHFHGLNEVKSLVDCQDVPGDYSDSIYSSQCKSKNHLTSQYGPLSIFRHYYQMLISNSIKIMNACVVVVSLIYILNLVINAQIEKSETDIAIAQKQAMQQKYAEEYAHREQELSRAIAIKSSVVFHDKIDALKEISPQNFMTDLSEYIARSGVDDITITNIEWNTKQVSVPNQRNKKADDIYELTSLDTIDHFAKVKGLIGEKTESFDQSVTKVRSLMSALNKYKNLKRLDVIKMPYDIRPNSKLSHSHSYETSEDSSLDKLRGFEFHMLIRGKNNV